MLRHIEHRHSDVKGVRHKVDCHKRLEHPLEEHGSVNVQCVLSSMFFK